MLSVRKIAKLASERGLKNTEQVVAFTLGYATSALQAGKQDLPKLTLHLYDHCPFCVRVEIVLGLKGIPFERRVYGYGDSLGDSRKGKYFGGRTLTGYKMLPVLEIHGRDPKYMGESSNIIAYLEGLGGPSSLPQIVPMAGQSKYVTEFFASSGTFKELQRSLTKGLVISMRHLKDWQRDEDVAYAKEKYEKSGFSFADAEKRAPELRTEMEKQLAVLDDLLATAKRDARAAYTWDDIVILPELRTLSCVPKLQWPEGLKKYVTDALAASAVSTYFP